MDSNNPSREAPARATILVISGDSKFLESIRRYAAASGYVAETYGSFADVPQPFPLQRFDVAICDHDLRTMPAIQFLEALDVALGDTFKVFPIIVVCHSQGVRALRADTWPLAVRRIISKDLDPRTIVTCAALEAAAVKAVDVWTV